MIINMVSESEFTVKAHGVHTAYLELTQALRSRDDTDVAVNTFRRPADITHVQTIGLYSVLHLVFGSGKKVISAHVVPASFVGSLRGAKYWLWAAKLYLRWVYGRADCVLAVSRTVERELHGSMNIKRRIEVLYNTVDMSRYAPQPDDKQLARQKLGIDTGQFVVVGNGQVQPRKRLDTFVAAAKALPDMTFIWIGGIPFKQLGADYAGMVKLMENVPKNVIITGVIDLKDVRTYLMAADVFFLPAEQENHPMCVLEAAGAGLPIILRDIPEYDDTFRPDAIFIQSDADAITALQKLLNDRTYYDAMRGASGRIARRFDSQTGANQVMSIYRSLSD